MFGNRILKFYSKLLVYYHYYMSVSVCMHVVSKLLVYYACICRYMSIASSFRFGSSITPTDVIYCALPLYHTNGGILGAGQMVLYGNALALRRKFSASNFWNDCIKYKCTVSDEWMKGMEENEKLLPTETWVHVHSRAVGLFFAY